MSSFNEALELMEKDQNREALKALEKAEETAGQAEANDIFLYIQALKGNLMQAVGAYEEALNIHSHVIKAAEELLIKDPDNEFYQFILQTNLAAIGTLGTLFCEMGRFPQAKNCCELQISIFQKLLKNDPKNITHQSNVAGMLYNLGLFLFNMGCLEEAKQKYEKALYMRQRLLRNYPENVVYQSYVAVTLNNLGNLLQDLELIEEAKQRYEEALEMYEKLLKNDPKNVTYQSNVAMTLNNLGTLLSNMERIEEAKQRYEKALEIYENLLETDPKNVDYQSYVGTTLNNLGVSLSGMGGIEEAKQRYEKALEMRQKLLNNDPENVVYQSDVAVTLNNLGTLLSDMGRIEEAKQKYEESLAIYTEPMQYLTIGKKSNSIIRLIDLNSILATEEKEPLDRMRYLKEVYKLCKNNQEFFIKYELRNERELVIEAGLNAYIDFLLKRMKLENGFEKRAEKYGKALDAVKKLEELEKEEVISRLYISAACYLEGRKYINEAFASGKTELGLVSEAVKKFKEAS